MDWTLAEIVRSHARNRGLSPMLTLGDRTLTYAGMYARARQVAHGLIAAGVGVQDRIAFLDKNGFEYFEVLFGGGMVNAVNVAVNWRLAPREMAYTINDAQAKVLVVGRDFFSQLAEIENELGTVKKIIALRLPFGPSPRVHSGSASAAWRGRVARALQPIEVIEGRHRSLDREHLKRKALVQRVQTRLVLKTLE